MKGKRDKREKHSFYEGSLIYQKLRLMSLSICQSDLHPWDGVCCVVEQGPCILHNPRFVFHLHVI